ncbi:hypothetical protein CYMTET_15457, partial [Cymbomonas tetramitiformis]
QKVPAPAPRSQKVPAPAPRSQKVRAPAPRSQKSLPTRVLTADFAGSGHPSSPGLPLTPGVNLAHSLTPGPRAQGEVFPSPPRSTQELGGILPITPGRLPVTPGGLLAVEEPGEQEEPQEPEYVIPKDLSIFKSKEKVPFRAVKAHKRMKPAERKFVFKSPKSWSTPGEVADHVMVTLSVVNALKKSMAGMLGAGEQPQGEGDSEDTDQEKSGAESGEDGESSDVDKAGKSWIKRRASKRHASPGPALSSSQSADSIQPPEKSSRKTSIWKKAGKAVGGRKRILSMLIPKVAAAEPSDASKSIPENEVATGMESASVPHF